jgi:hypothetical protein
MARVIVESDDGRTRIEVRQDVETGETFGFCEAHQIKLTDRGQFEDTCESIANHIDREHGEVHQS